MAFTKVMAPSGILWMAVVRVMSYWGSEFMYEIDLNMWEFTDETAYMKYGGRR